jgi:Helicase associated domain
VQFNKTHGHARVMSGHQERGLNLGNWVKEQRRIKETLTPDQITRLDSLGFSWDPLADRWEENFAALVQFNKDNGHVRVLQSHREHGFNLGIWVNNQRSRKERLTPDQIKRLDSLGFSWDAIARSKK